MALTQLDIEKELILLQNIDLAHMISLGGWVRALCITSKAAEQNFDPEKAKLIFREDIADYYLYSLESMNPEIKKSDQHKILVSNVTKLKDLMLLKEAEVPNVKNIKTIHACAKAMSELIR